MKKFILGGLAVLLIALGAAFGFGVLKLGGIEGNCAMDEEIAGNTRGDMDNTAMQFVRAALSSNPGSAYALMTPEAQKSTSPDKLSALLGSFVQQMGPFSAIKISHTYFLQTSGSGPETKAICGLVSGDKWVSVSVKPGMSQGHVLISGETRNNTFSFTLWLLPENDTWRVQYFNMNPSEIVGYDSEALLAMARKQRDTGHAFNAAMLYAGVQAVMARGPAFQLGVVQAANDDLTSFKLPQELQGVPPFHWNFGGNNYVVSQVTIIGIDHKLGLVFVLPQDRWGGDGAADKRNHAFLDGFVAAHPDYASVFGFLVARAIKPDNSGGFGTVYNADTGYK